MMNKPLSRRSRGERTKRRERYLLLNRRTNFYECEFDNNVLIDDSLSSSTDSGHCSIENNYTTRNSRMEAQNSVWMHFFSCFLIKLINELEWRLQFDFLLIRFRVFFLRFLYDIQLTLKWILFSYSETR